MEILKGLDYKVEKSAVSLGKFDGIHLGHRLLLNDILEKKELVPTVFTFSIDRNGKKDWLPEKQIYVQEEKGILLSEMGIEREVVFLFNEKTHSMSPEEFIKKILVERLGAQYVSVGEDYHFGKDRAGNVDTLAYYAGRYGYELSVHPKVKYDGKVVSSTRIRECLKKGEMKSANMMLGEPFFVQGEVIHGNALGRTMNMPTANVRPADHKLLPPCGVYATVVTVKGKNYRGVTNIGRKPTIGEYAMGVETYIMDFDEDIYGEEIKVQFYEFLRPETKFPSLDALKEQMERDKRKAAKCPVYSCFTEETSSEEQSSSN